MSEDVDTLVAELRKAAKDCQVGVPRGRAAYDRLHDLLAEHYSLFHRAAAALERAPP